jgi:predicted DNA-binding transcriptional regulator YafY
VKADRLLSALLLLQAHRKLKGREIARRLEVSERTVHRDMEALGAAGVPVYAERGAQGGWRLDEDWRTRVPGLDAAELQALLMAQPRVIGDSRLAGAAEGALRKLMAALPVSLREQAVAMRQRLHVDVQGWRGGVEDLSCLPVVQDAVARDRKLSISYRKASHEVVDRIVDPLGLVAKGTAWYLVAKGPEGIRTYRVSRIEKAVLLEAPCERPPDFDLAAHWASSTEAFRETRARYDATLRLEPLTAARFKTWRTGRTPVENETVDAAGWTTLHVQFEDADEATFVCLGLGSRGEVLAPEALQERVRAEALVVLEGLKQGAERARRTKERSARAPSKRRARGDRS